MYKPVHKQYAEPLMYAIRRHFVLKKVIREEKFQRFKRRNWMVLCIAGLIVIFSEAFCLYSCLQMSGFMKV